MGVKPVVGLGIAGARWRRSVLTLSLLGATACGLVFSPGEYTDVGGVEPVATVEDASAPVIAEAGADAPTPAAARIVLFAGQRALFPGEQTMQPWVAETIHTTVSADGELGAWRWDIAPPRVWPWTAAAIFGGVLWLQTDWSVHRVGFDGGIAGDWRSFSPLAVVSLPERSLRPWIGEAGVLFAGGFVDGEPTRNVYQSPFTGEGDLGPLVALEASQLAAARASAVLHRHGRFLYAVGGRTSLSDDDRGSNAVDVTSIGEDGLPGPFVETSALDLGSPDAPHGLVSTSIASGAGHLVVVGGWTTGQPSSLTDVVLAARIDEATGMLGSWTVLPRFPTPVGAAAVFVVANTIFVFGGMTPADATDAVMALPIHADGTFGSEWKRVGSLPGPRAWLAGVVY